MLAKLQFLYLAVPLCVSAQAWLFPKGEGAVAFSYQNLLVRDHVYSKGEAVDVGHILSHALNVDVDYSLTDRLAVRVTLPFIAAKYDGTKPHQLPFDNGRYNSSFQDVTADLRYNLVRRKAMLTPFFRAVIPSHSYEYFGHSAVGRDLLEYHIGTNFGRRLDPILPRAYFQGRYSYAFVERILGIRPNHSNAEFQLGYFLTPRFSLLALGQWMHTYDGVELLNGVFHAGLPDDQWHHHDQIGKASLLDLGGGAVWAASRSLQLFISLGRSIEGTNGHLHAAVVTVGVGRTFGGKSEGRNDFSRLDEPEPRKAFVCACARSN